MSQHSEERPTPASLYTQLDISSAGQVGASASGSDNSAERTELLRDILAAQDRNNELLEELVSAMATSQKQRSNELNQWKQANPQLARACRESAEGLSQVQVRFLEKMTDEINDTVEGLMDGEFMLSEFVDKFGPRLAHLNGVIQVLAQLSSVPNPTDSSRPQ